ncbi:MAG: hypothetical protein N2167_10940 [Flavobacteriales bacterium]|nr:hypothetical protein [Flavobacteriales bacterium]
MILRFVNILIIIISMLCSKHTWAIGDLKEYAFPQLGLKLNYFKDAVRFYPPNYTGGWIYNYHRRANSYASDTVFKSNLVVDTLYKGAIAKHVADLKNFKSMYSNVKYDKEYKYVGEGLYIYFYRGYNNNATGDFFIYSSKKFIVVITFIYFKSEDQKIESLHENILNSIKESPDIINLPQLYLSIPLKGRLTHTIIKENNAQVYIHDIYINDTYNYYVVCRVLNYNSMDELEQKINLYKQDASKGIYARKFLQIKEYNTLVDDFYWISKYHSLSFAVDFLENIDGKDYYLSEYFLVVPNTFQTLACQIFLEYPSGVKLNVPPDELFIKEIMHNVVKNITVLPPNTKPNAKSVQLQDGFCASRLETFYDRLFAIIRSTKDDFKTIRGRRYPVTEAYYSRYNSFIQLDSLSKSYIDYFENFKFNADYGYCKNGRKQADELFDALRNKLIDIKDYPFGEAKLSDYSSYSSNRQFYVYPVNKLNEYGRYELRLYMNTNYLYEYGDLISYYRNNFFIEKH